MKRKDMLNALERCAKTEEVAVPIYRRHVDNPLFLSELTAEERTDVLKMLTLLGDESQKHAQDFRNLIARVRGAEQDVY